MLNVSANYYYYYRIIKNEKIRVTLCENAAGALYIVSNVSVLLMKLLILLYG